jgi:hypothetical protein
VANQHGIKLRCYWEHLGVTLHKPFGNLMGTHHPGFFWVTNVFSSCSLDVFQDSKLFSKAFSIAPQFYPIWFAQSFNSHVYKLRRRTAGEYFCFYFATGGPKTCFHWGVLSVPKRLLMGEWIWLFSKKEEKLWAHPWTNLYEWHYVPKILVTSL